MDKLESRISRIARRIVAYHPEQFTGEPSVQLLRKNMAGAYKRVAYRLQDFGKLIGEFVDTIIDSHLDGDENFDRDTMRLIRDRIWAKNASRSYLKFADDWDANSASESLNEDELGEIGLVINNLPPAVSEDVESVRALVKKFGDYDEFGELELIAKEIEGILKQLSKEVEAVRNIATQLGW